MGQYHNVVNLDKGFFYSARSLANGVKSMEQGVSFTSCAAMAHLLAHGWNGERVFLIGDYAEQGDVNNFDGDLSKLYDGEGMRNVGWLGRKVIEEMEGEFSRSSYKFRDSNGVLNTRSMYEFVSQLEDIDPDKKLDGAVPMRIVNFDKKQMIIPGHFSHNRKIGPDSVNILRSIILNGWNNREMTALFILLTASAKGGKRGGGDPIHKLNGVWAGDRVGIIPANEAAGFEDISSSFNPDGADETLIGHIG